MNRKRSPLHDFWHRRIDGQIKHTIGQHPEWFKFSGERQKKTIINSIAKRIVGEIVAAGISGSIPDYLPLSDKSGNGNDGVGLSLPHNGMMEYCSVTELSEMS